MLNTICVYRLHSTLKRFLGKVTIFLPYIHVNMSITCIDIQRYN